MLLSLPSELQVLELSYFSLPDLVTLGTVGKPVRELVKSGEFQETLAEAKWRHFHDLPLDPSLSVEAHLHMYRSVNIASSVVRALGGLQVHTNLSVE